MSAKGTHREKFLRSENFKLNLTKDGVKMKSLALGCVGSAVVPELSVPPERVRVRGWAVMGKPGLYTGWAITRNQAIEDHLRVFYRGSSPPPLSSGDILSPEQKAEWKHRCSIGDRCVPISILVHASRSDSLKPRLVAASESIAA